jgi:hypothetical protein
MAIRVSCRRIERETTTTTVAITKWTIVIMKEEVYIK